MFRKIIVVLSMLTVAANIIIAEELQVAKNTSIGLYYDWQSITMSDYLTAKIGTANEYINYLNNKALLKGFLPDYYLSITCPQNLANYGVRLSYKVTDEFAINIHGFTSSISGTDSLNWTDSSNGYVNYTSKWKFNINDVGMGIGYIKDDFMIKNTRSNFGVSLGVFYAELIESDVRSQDLTLISTDTSKGFGIINSYPSQSWFGNNISLDITWLYQVYLTQNKNVSFDITSAYKIATLNNVGNYSKLDFSGFKFGAGISYCFENYSK